jgi:pyrophosphate--fructose-6-phosphate 1-phosphotransferase
MPSDAAPQPIATVAFLTAGGLAPCLSSALGYLIEAYSVRSPETRLICYKGGYKGLLAGDFIEVTPEMRAKIGILQLHGGSPIGNSRVKLTNVKDCVKRGLVKEGQDPQQVAADQLVKDKVDILHTIGGDDTNLAAASLADFLKQNGFSMTVIGMPKTIDNDVVPIKQSLGAWTAAEKGAEFFSNVVAESTANPRMFIVHEVMGRDCGWLTAATANEYMKKLTGSQLMPELFVDQKRLAVHGVYLPEMDFNIEAEAKRLKAIMDEHDCVNIFISEGAGVHQIVAEKQAKGIEVPRDAFGHIKLDAVNVGQYFAETFSKLIGAEKTLVQKSGYFARAAPANEADRTLIRQCAMLAVDCAFKRIGGVMGHDEENGDILSAIAFDRIKGGKCFDLSTSWFTALQAEIGQPQSAPKTHVVEYVKDKSLNKRLASGRSSDALLGVVGFDAKVPKTCW